MGKQRFAKDVNILRSDNGPIFLNIAGFKNVFHSKILAAKHNERSVSSE